MLLNYINLVNVLVPPGIKEEGINGVIPRCFHPSTVSFTLACAGYWGKMVKW